MLYAACLAIRVSTAAYWILSCVLVRRRRASGQSRRRLLERHSGLRRWQKERDMPLKIKPSPVNQPYPDDQSTTMLPQSSETMRPVKSARSQARRVSVIPPALHLPPTLGSSNLKELPMAVRSQSPTPYSKRTSV